MNPNQNNMAIISHTDIIENSTESQPILIAGCTKNGYSLNEENQTQGNTEKPGKTKKNTLSESRSTTYSSQDKKTQEMAEQANPQDGLRIDPEELANNMTIQLEKEQKARAKQSKQLKQFVLTYLSQGETLSTIKTAYENSAETKPFSLLSIAMAHMANEYVENQKINTTELYKTVASKSDEITQNFPRVVKSIFETIGLIHKKEDNKTLRWADREELKQLATQLRAKREQKHQAIKKAASAQKRNAVMQYLHEEKESFKGACKKASTRLFGDPLEKAKKNPYAKVNTETGEVEVKDQPFKGELTQREKDLIVREKAAKAFAKKEANINMLTDKAFKAEVKKRQQEAELRKIEEGEQADMEILQTKIKWRKIYEENKPFILIAAAGIFYWFFLSGQSADSLPLLQSSQSEPMYVQNPTYQAGE